ncbi:MAG: SlyX family protein [Rhizobiaceae bacterium]|nr:SlyX family protein [Rhizobiaceae bacterium]
MTQDTNERIIRLEMLVAEQERTIAELSEQLSEQWSLTEKMRKKLDALTERFLVLEEQTAPETPVTKPPHY